jgi:hypothetical protein
MEQKRVHKTGDIVENLENPRKVNCLRSNILDNEYYVADNKLYKKLDLKSFRYKRLKSGEYKKLNSNMYRELVLQVNDPRYIHYFLHDRNKKKLTVSVKKLCDLTYCPPEFLTDIKGNESEQFSTESRTEVTETEIDKTGQSELEQ